MNLYDIVRREDRALRRSEGVRTDEPRVGRARHRVLVIEPGGVLELSDVDEFTVMQGFPRELGWHLVDNGEGPCRLAVHALTGAGDAGGREHLVSRTEIAGSSPSPRPPGRPGPLSRIRGRMTAALAVTAPGDEVPVRFDWPLEAGIRPGLGLRLQAAGKAPAMLSIGRAFDPRARLLPLMRGVGVEVGPGANPQVRPAAGVDVHYIESASAEEWARRYRKQGGDDLGPLWDRYRVDSAHELAGVADGSLDFIFSNHVFEHLVNPLGVLLNWVRKLRPGGLIAGATPDARYSFDLRQPLSGPQDFLRERDAGGFDLEDRHYDRWCRYTAPYNRPDELRARGYSIHAHYYSPAGFTALAGLLPGAFDQVFTDTSPNNKDFGFLLRKSVEPA